MRSQDAIRLAHARRLAESGRAEALRHTALLTLHEVARVCEVNHVTVMRWEKGERTPSGDAALRWVDFMAKLEAAFGEPAEPVEVEEVAAP
jgi:DNA-binding transcriptional regulator YiaG